MKINGKWYFNEVVSDCPARSEYSFVSNGKNYIAMNASIADKNRFSYYYQGTSYDNAWLNGSWTDEAYRTIDFGAAYQEVSDEFYNWLTANAVQLTKPIPMTHPKGIKLLTKGHKLSKDLEVVPTFMETVTANITNGGLGADEYKLYATRFVNGKLVTEQLTEGTYSGIVKDSLIVVCVLNTNYILGYNGLFSIEDFYFTNNEDNVEVAFFKVEDNVSLTFE